ncbi:MAG: hypothetical protein AABX16_02735 [Nanoarchaeota archaeon]
MTTERKKIGIDRNECKNEFIFGFLHFYNLTYRIHFQLSDVTNYNLWEILGCSKQELIQKIHAFYESPYFFHLPVAPGSQEAIRQLAKHYDLYIITSRPKILQEKTKRWTHQHFFPDRFKKIIFTNEWNLNGTGKNKSKGDLCKELGISYMIEDNADYANECAEQGISVFLLKKLWNQKSAIHSNVCRVTNWHEILQKMEQINYD